MSTYESALFRNLTADQVKSLLKAVHAEETFFERGDIIFQEGEEVDRIGLIVEGKVVISNSFESGKEVDIATLYAGDIFAEVLIFSDNNKVPNQVRCDEDSRIIFFTKEDLLGGLFSHPLVFQNFLRILSNKVYTLSQKQRLMSLDQLRKKVVSYLLSYEKKDFECKLSREEMARYLGVPRPSLSRELSQLKELGYIDYYRNSFSIKDRAALENCLT